MAAQDNNIIKHDNIVYVHTISPLGGVETFAYELVKKYKDNDIAVVCKKIDLKQKERLEQFCSVYVHTTEKIKCKTIIINYDNDILNYVDDIENVNVCETIHADYHNSYYSWYPVIDKRVKHWLGITDYSRKHFEEMFNVKTELCYNPLTLDTKQKILTLVSATRLSKIKGKKRMEKLGKALDEAGIKYVWFVFTEDTQGIDNPNIIFKKPDLDVRPWIMGADYVVQLSDTECCSYTINEALGCNVPVIVTPLPYLSEVGYEDGKTGYTVEFDCSNINDVANKMTNIPTFKGNIPADSYDKYITKGKSHYQEDLNSIYVVSATEEYQNRSCIDTELKKIPQYGEVWEVSKKRFDILNGGNKQHIKFVELKEIKKPKQKTIEKPKPIVQPEPIKPTKPVVKKYKILNKESL